MNDRSASPPPEPVTDPAELARMADESRARTGAVTRLALYFAGQSGLYAGRRGAPRSECPFEDADLRDRWMWHRDLAARVADERRREGTANLFGEPQ